MFRIIIFLILATSVGSLSAQTLIAGQIDLDSVVVPDARVYLSQIKLEDFPDRSAEIGISTAAVDENGFFAFEQLQLAKRNAIYRIYVNRFEAALNKISPTDQLFIFSASDSIQFAKSTKPFRVYNNTNKADLEWQRLRRYESALYGSGIRKEDSLALGYTLKMKNYAKDSLQILMVKLISIKQLDQKQLLEKDILQNPDYYLSLLAALKQSDLDRSDYLFLENRLAFLTTDRAEAKLRTSTFINLILALGLVVLLTMFFILYKKRKSISVGALSKQERTVQQLILQGKSNKEIAGELFISLSTVKTHITNIYSKLQVSNRQELLHKTRN